MKLLTRRLRVYFQSRSVEKYPYHNVYPRASSSLQPQTQNLRARAWMSLVLSDITHTWAPLYPPISHRDSPEQNCLLILPSLRSKEPGSAVSLTLRPTCGRFLVFHGGYLIIAAVVGQLRDRIPSVTRSNCAFPPLSCDSWDADLRCLNSYKGGWLHAHGRMEIGDVGRKSVEIVVVFRRVQRNIIVSRLKQEASSTSSISN